MTDRQTSLAIVRAYLAWQQTQPQLTIDGWADMLDGLDQTQARPLGLVEPAASSPGRALTNVNGTGAPACRLARPCQEGA